MGVVITLRSRHPRFPSATRVVKAKHSDDGPPQRICLCSSRRHQAAEQRRRTRINERWVSKDRR
eukprot:1157563-Pelagomonas_calceolata.AAC.7